MNFHTISAICFFSIIKQLHVQIISDEHTVPYERYYKEGVESYLDDDWGACSRKLELALDTWHNWTNSLIRCRKTCDKVAKEADLLPTNVAEESKFYERLIRNTLCLTQCKKKAFGRLHDAVAGGETLQDFEKRKPYDFLQLCYFKLGRLHDAANAAATVLAVQPDHEVMQSNLNYYVQEADIHKSEVTNLELQEYEKEYLRGCEAYGHHDYKNVISVMESSLEKFWDAYEACRFSCEAPFDQGWFPDFVSSVANHYTFTLRCKRKCSIKLSNIYGGNVDLDDFIPSYFHYLEYAYHQAGNLQKAAEAVQSYLHLVPEDLVQVRNKQFLWTLDGIREEYFKPRKEVEDFKAVEDYEASLLEFIERNFVSLARKMDDAGFVHDNRNISEPFQPKAGMQRKPSDGTDAPHANLSHAGIRVVFGETELNGTTRVVADGFLSNEQCKSIIKVTQQAASSGDGYNNRVSPHTKYETFEGLTLSRLGLLVHAGLVSPDILELVLNATILAKLFVQQNFQLTHPLYFSFTHLVCRTAIEDPLLLRPPYLSHEIHVDNCILQHASEECLRIPPAYTFRDYSAVLYLNSGFAGGEFIFSSDKSGSSYQSMVKPVCGRLVGFSAGKENPHGVRGVTQGSRCALALWFTLNKKYQELEWNLSMDLLTRIKSGQILPGHEEYVHD